jgi:hypothetical protein
MSIHWCMCTYPIDLMGIHLLPCAHNDEHIRTHDVVRNTFVAIAQDVGFHVRWEQLHVLPSNTFNSSYQRINIVLTKDDICTLVDVNIANPTLVDLLPWSCTTQRFVASNVVQAKQWSYCDRHLADQFLPLAVDVFGCLHNRWMCFYTIVPMPFGVWKD